MSLLPATLSSVYRNGIRVQVQVFKCVKCVKCDAKLRIPCNTISSTLPHSVLKRKATQKGWRVGRRCVCPDCQ